MTHKISVCFYTIGEKEDYKKGIYVQDIKRNTFVVLTTKLKVVNVTRLIIASDSYGCVYFNLRR